MKFQNFFDLPGKTDLERSQCLVANSPNGIYVQNKYNGVNCRIQRRHDGTIALRTKNDKYWTIAYFGEIFDTNFHKILDRRPAWTINAEIIAVDPEVKLATLAGWVNVKSVYCHEPNKVQFVFNDVYHDEVAIPFGTRQKYLAEFCREVRDPLIHVAPTDLIRDADELEDIYRTRTEAGFEGIMLRVDPCYYFDGKSPTLHGWKRPKYYTDEGRILYAHEGEGKRKGMLGAFGILWKGKVFNVGGGADLTDAQLTEYWINSAKYVDAPATFRYAELSIEGIPLRPQLLGVRNYE